MTYRMLVLGDSILWGQGLREATEVPEPEKISDRVRAALALRGHDVEVHRYAHSGSDVWEDGLDDEHIFDVYPGEFGGAWPPLQDDIRRSDLTEFKNIAGQEGVGEIPCEKPFTLRQLMSAVDDLAGRQVDLVLVDAGINDVDLYSLVIPYKDIKAVERRAASFTGRLNVLLDRLHEAFPQARIVVTGYYPIVSQRSDLGSLLTFNVSLAKAIGEEAAARVRRELLRFFDMAPYGLLGPLVNMGREADPTTLLDEVRYLFQRVPTVDRLLQRQLTKLSNTWLYTMHRVLTKDIEDFNARLGARRAAFADPEFGPEHALYADKTLLWSLDPDLEPLDPKRQRRAALCDAEMQGGLKDYIARRASFGHPRPEGAARYASAVMRAVDRVDWS